MSSIEAAARPLAETASRRAGHVGLPLPRRYWSAATIWLALTLSVLDGSIANVALPTIAHDLAAPPAEAIWVINAYQLTIVVSLLPLAALGEMVSFRRVFLVGVVLFSAASLGCCFAWSLPALAAARAIQGFGAAAIMSQNGALVRLTYPPDKLGRGIGLNALVASGAAALGPTIAAGILAVGPWQWLFAINLPVGIAAFMAGRRSLPENARAGSFDAVGAVLNVLVFGPLFIGVDMLTRGADVWLGGGLLLLALVAGLVLVRWSLPQARPTAPVDLLRSRAFALTVVTSIGSFTAQMLAFVSLPFYLEGTLHRGQVETGLLLTPWPLAVCVAAPTAGRLADRLPVAILSAAGLVVMALGLGLLAFLPVEATDFEIGWRMALCGAGFGFFQAPNNRAMLSSAPLERSGAAGGMLATARLTGQTTGATLAAISFRLAVHSENAALTLAAAIALAGAIASISRLASKPSRA